ncbi:MAG: copper resistance protein CopC/CopD [Gemmatimonadaceae bacterium]|nr:copper resistance protein CopC/CopD [Gemmatimonadaceae bacterium]
MSPSRRPGSSASRAVRFQLSALLVAVAGWLATPANASAHGGLKSSDPAPGDTVRSVLTRIRLDFSEAPEMAFTSVQLRGPSGSLIDTGKPVFSGPLTLVLSFPGVSAPGTYTVIWRTAGKDGHPVRGRFTFAIAPRGDAPVPAAGTTDAVPAPFPTAGMAPMEMHHDSSALPSGGPFDAQSTGYAVIRWFQFATLVSLLGAFAFQYLVLGFLRRKQHPDSPMLAVARRRAAEIAQWAAVALALLAVVRLLAQSLAMHGGADVMNLRMMGPMIGQTTWGAGWLLQLFGSALVFAGLRFASRNSRRGWAIAAAGALAVAFSPGLSGHAASTPNISGLAVAADALHVIGAGGWLGSLLFVVIVGVPAALKLESEQQGPAVADLFNSFSPTALLFAGITATTGVFAAWLHLRSVTALWQTDYGATLLVKLTILSVVAGTGAYNWLRVKPALGKLEGAARIRRSATFELAVGLLVLAVTAVLVATPTAVDEEMMRGTDASIEAQLPGPSPVDTTAAGIER